jgi:DNA-binding MarR family transcriptional regulator
MPELSGSTLRFMRRLWQLSHALDVRSKRMETTLGITGPQRLVVRVIGQRPGSTATEIAAMLNMHPSTLTGVLARLQQRSMILRVRDPRDRRRSRFELTATGRAIDHERRGTVEAAIRRGLARLGQKRIADVDRALGILADELLRDEMI